jgi:tRNA(fMet)-specific endonuclease VapC
MQNQWSKIKIARLEFLFEESQVIQIDDLLLRTYVDIDTYSQKKHPDFINYPFDTPRNMGKHDIWIAATASLLNLQLITTDQDFNHLENVFINLKYISPSEIQNLL